MSAYRQQMERHYSDQSLSSIGDSDTEIRSDYAIESGYYMTSFAAAVFVAALVSVGILLMTLLIALTVMLQSCQTKRTGALEMWKSNDDYNYCKIFALNAEHNGLDARSVPEFCRHVAIQYIRGGQYMRDLETTALLIENYLNNIRPLADVRDVVLMDVDDFVHLDNHYFSPPRLKRYICPDCVEEAKRQKQVLSQQLYLKLQAGGWPVVLLSRTPEKLRNTVVEYLISAGSGNSSSLIMRLDEEMQTDSREYISRGMNKMQQQGFHVRAVISSKMDTLSGPILGSHIFKIPSPIYFNTQ